MTADREFEVPARIPHATKVRVLARSPDGRMLRVERLGTGVRGWVRSLHVYTETEFWRLHESRPTYRPGRRGIVTCSTLHFELDTLVARDDSSFREDSMQHLKDAGGAIEIPRGTRARIASVDARGYLRVELISGTQEGAAGWIPRRSFRIESR